MISFYNSELTSLAAYLKLNVYKISCGTFTGNWSVALPFNRLIYIFQGSSVTSRISNSEMTFEMTPGRWLFIPEGMKVHHEQYDGLFLISLQFNLELINGIEYMHGCSSMYMGSAPEKRDDFYSLFETKPKISDVFQLQKLIWEFVQPIVEAEKKNLLNLPDHLFRYQTLLDKFRNHQYSDFSVAEMAEIMKMGKESFIKHFTEEFGTPPKLFFLRQRAAAAAKELLATDDSIREIAERFHFSDEFYFSRFMKRMTGLSPREYRNKMSFQS